MCRAPGIAGLAQVALGAELRHGRRNAHTRRRSHQAKTGTISTSTFLLVHQFRLDPPDPPTINKECPEVPDTKI